MKLQKFKIKGFKEFVILFLMLFIVILSFVLVEDHNLGFETGRYQGWVEACDNTNNIFGLDSLGQYTCAYDGSLLFGGAQVGS